jgi:hypothetical protein
LALLNPFKLVQNALFLLKVAFISTGIGAILAGIAMAGVWIYNNWSGLGEFFTGFWASFREALGPAAPLIDGIVLSAKKLWSWLTQMLGPLDASKEQWNSWGTGAGKALGNVVGKVSSWASENGALISSIAKLYGGFLALRMVWRIPLGPLRTAGRLLAWVGTGPLKLLLSGVGLLSKAFIRLGLLMLANPIGLIIASVAALAAVVYLNWDKIVGYISEKIAVIKAAFDGGLINGVFAILAELNPFRLMLDSIQGLIAYVMELLGVPDQIVTAFAGIDLWDTGVSILQSLWNGMASLVPKMVSTIAAKLSNIVPAWMRDAWNWANGDAAAPAKQVPAISNSGTAKGPQNRGQRLVARDAGGPVRPGQGYEVGERGREYFMPGVAGSILPTRVLQAAVSAASMVPPSVDQMGVSNSLIETHSNTSTTLSKQVLNAAISTASVARHTVEKMAHWSCHGLVPVSFEQCLL